MLADRLPRDRRTRVAELLDTFPGALYARLFGKYLGSTLATLVPMFLIYSLGVGYIIARWHALQILPLALATFGAIALPGLLFIGAWTLAFSSVIWTPLYQFLFIGYWFWGNLLLGIGIPSPGSTILTPVGGYMCTGFSIKQDARAFAIQALRERRLCKASRACCCCLPSLSWQCWRSPLCSNGNEAGSKLCYTTGEMAVWEESEQML